MRNRIMRRIIKFTSQIKIPRIAHSVLTLGLYKTMPPAFRQSSKRKTSAWSHAKRARRLGWHSHLQAEVTGSFSDSITKPSRNSNQIKKSKRSESRLQAEVMGSFSDQQHKPIVQPSFFEALLQSAITSILSIPRVAHFALTLGYYNAMPPAFMKLCQRHKSYKHGVSEAQPHEPAQHTFSVLKARLIHCALLLCLFISPFTHAADKIPQRIVTLGSSVTQQLYLLGAGNRIVGNTTYCNVPEEAKNKEKVGTIRSINVEKILSLKPDIVFSTGMSSMRQVQLLQKLGIKTEPILTPKSFDEICANFEMLGQITGQTKEAKTIIDSAKSVVQEQRNKIKKTRQPKVFFQIGVKPIFTVSKNFYLNDLISFSGGINIAENESEGIYSREKVIAENPDIIIITTMGVNGDKEKETWMKFTELNAVKNNSIFIVSSEKMCNPNPVSFVENLKHMVAILNKSKKWVQ